MSAIESSKMKISSTAVAILVVLAAAFGEAAQKPAPSEKLPVPVVAELRAAQRIREFGGWYELDGEHHVVEVNMVYHEEGGGPPIGTRQDNNVRVDDALFNVPQFPRLKRLLLMETQASDKGLQAVGQLPELEELYIWDGLTITDDGISHLRKLPKLRMLHLSNSKITDQAIFHLSEIRTLEELSMQGNAFTDKAYEYAARLPNLKRLILDNESPGNARLVTDDAMRHVRQMPQLEELWLQNTGVTDKGLRELHGLTKLKRLVLDSSNDENITVVGLAKLQEAVPGLEVLSDGPAMPPLNEVRAAADPQQRRIQFVKAREGLQVIRELVELVSTNRDRTVASLAAPEVVAALKSLRGRLNNEPLEIISALGDANRLLITISPGFTYQVRNEARDVIAEKSGQVLLHVKNSPGGWRAETVVFGEMGSDEPMKRWKTLHPAAQELIVP